MRCGRPGPKTPVVVIYGANDNQFMVGPDALTAKNALTEIPYNKRICLLETGVMGMG